MPTISVITRISMNSAVFTPSGYISMNSHLNSGVSPLTKNRLRMPVKIISGRIGFTLFRIMTSFILASI